MQRKDYLLAETNWQVVKDTNYELAILPWGATEAHNFHLPYATDNIQVEHVAAEAAKQVWEKGRKVVVLPAIPFGVQGGQLGVKFNINMNPSTQFYVLRDIVQSLEKQGIKKLVIINGHGGNSFSQMIRELYPQIAVTIFTMDWFKVVNPSEFFEAPGDHADEMETSVMLKIAPQLVSDLKVAGSGAAKTLNLPSMKEGWLWTQRGWLNEVTEDTGLGDPRAATPEKGEAYLKATIVKVAKALEEIVDLNLDDRYC